MIDLTATGGERRCGPAEGEFGPAHHMARPGQPDPGGDGGGLGQGGPIAPGPLE